MSTDTKQRKFWITFRIGIQGGIVDGDLVAESEKLDEAFLHDVKKQVAIGFIRNNGGVIPTGMNDPMIVACIPLED